MNLLTTLKGSLLEDFFPAGWDLAQWDACVADDPKAIFERQPKWHKDYSVRMANNVADFDVMLGHELAMEIRRAREAGRKLALILPVGPMGMYRWTVYFLRDWNVPCDHVTGFNMDEWSDAEGNTLPGDDPGAFQYAMEMAFYGPLANSPCPRGNASSPRGNCCPNIRSASAPCARRGPNWWWSTALAAPAILRFGSRTLEWSSRAMQIGAADASPGRALAPADHRAERHHQLQEPDDAGSRLRQHHRPSVLYPRRLCHWRRGWRTGPRHAMARVVAVGNAAAPREPSRSIHLDADSAGRPLLHQGARRAFGSGG